MLTHEEFRKTALSNPEVQVEYEKLKPEFMLPGYALDSSTDYI